MTHVFNNGVVSEYTNADVICSYIKSCYTSDSRQDKIRFNSSLISIDMFLSLDQLNKRPTVGNIDWLRLNFNSDIFSGVKSILLYFALSNE